VISPANETGDPKESTPVLWLYGADAVGKSTVAWEIYSSVTSKGVRAAYLDTDYLGFCSPIPYDDPSPLVAANLTSMWPNFQAAGASCLIVSGIMVTAEQRQRFESAIPDARLTLCRLRARSETLTERILRRGRAEGVETDGAVTGFTLDGLQEYAKRAGTFAELLDAQDIADFAVDTDNRSVPEIAQTVLAEAGSWPG
jgi:hypothetical protein